MSSYYNGGSTPSDSSDMSDLERRSTTVQRGSTVRNTSEDVSDDSTNRRSPKNLSGKSRKSVPTDYNRTSDRTGSSFQYEITLSYTVKTEYQDGRWEPQAPARDSANTSSRGVYNPNVEDADNSYSAVGTIPLSKGPYKFDNNSDLSMGYTSKTIEWTIGSSKPIDYGYHLDESPWVRDNGDLHLIEVGGDAKPGTGKNSWYEDFKINQTCINPDLGKMISESVGQISEIPGSVENFELEPPREENWTYDPYYTHRCITESRGFETDTGPTPYTDDDATLLLGCISISSQKDNKGKYRREPDFGTASVYGKGSTDEIWPVPFDGRGTLKSTSSIEAYTFYPRGEVLSPIEVSDKVFDSAAEVPDVTKAELPTTMFDGDGGDYYWMAAWTGVYNTSVPNSNSVDPLTYASFNEYEYGQDKTRAPYWREEFWYGPDPTLDDKTADGGTEADPNTWEKLYTGNVSNRIQFGTQPSNSYDEVVNNTGKIKDRDGDERWSGIWSEEANHESHKLTANDLVVSSISHYDENAIKRGRRYWRARYNLYLALRGNRTEDGMYNQSANGYNYLRFGNDLRTIGATVEGVSGARIEYEGNEYFPGDDLPPGVVGYELSSNRRTIIQWKFWWQNIRPDYYVMPSTIIEYDADNSNTQTTIDVVSTDTEKYVDQPFYPDAMFTDNQEDRPKYLQKDPSLKSWQFDTVQDGWQPGQGMSLYDSHGMWARAGFGYERRPYMDLLGCLSVVPGIKPEDIQAPADIDKNGLVDAADLAVVLADWGSKNSIADISGALGEPDGAVDGADITAILSSWYRGPDYNKTFRPPVNWDPTDRSSAPYMTERDDVEDYTYNNPSTLEDVYDDKGNFVETGNIGQRGYPTLGMDADMPAKDGNLPDGKVEWAKIGWNTTDPIPTENSLAPKDYFTLADAFYPAPSYRDEAGSLASLKYKGGMESSPIYLRLGTVSPWYGSAQNDEKISGFTTYFGAHDISYGATRAVRDEMHMSLVFDTNLDHLSDKSITYDNYPALYWLNKHFGVEAETNKQNRDPSDNDFGKSDYPKFGGERFNLRKKIRRAFAQRGIDHYGGYRSLGKFSAGNGGHTDWWDPLLIWGLAVTGNEDWFNMLDRGGEPEGNIPPTSENYDRGGGPGVNIGSERNGTYKDLDFAYSAANRNNHGTLGFEGIASLGPQGQQCYPLYTDNSDYVPYGKRSFYCDKIIKDLYVNKVRDYDFSFRGDQNTIWNDDYVDKNNIHSVDGQVFENRLVTIHPPLGTDTGNVADNMLWKLAELAEDIKNSTTASNQCKRNEAWAPLKKVYTDPITEEKLDEVYNDLKSGVEPHSVVDKDQPYSILHSVNEGATGNIVSINAVKLNTWNRYDNDGVQTGAVEVDTYVPHRSLNRVVNHDIRSIGRWSEDNKQNGGDPWDGSTDGGWMSCSEGNGYFKDIAESEYSLSEEADVEPRSGLSPDVINGKFSRFMKPGKNPWGSANNKGTFNNNSFLGYYVKNTENDKVTRILAADLEVVTYKEGARFDENTDWIGSLDGGPNSTTEVTTSIDTRAKMEPNDNVTVVLSAQRALRCVLQDDIGLTENTRVELSPWIRQEIKDDLAMFWCNPNNARNQTTTKGRCSYGYAYFRGTLTFAMSIRMIAGLSNKNTAIGSATDDYQQVLKRLPVYFQRQYPKYVSMWTTASGRLGTELNKDSTFSTFWPGVSSNRAGGTNKTNEPLNPNNNTSIYGDYSNLIRALFRQQLVDVLDDRGVASWWGDPANAKNGFQNGTLNGLSIKTRLVKWPLDERTALIDATGAQKGDIDVTFPDMAIEPSEYSDSKFGITAICTNPPMGFFQRGRDGQNISGWDQLDGQQVSFYWNKDNREADNSDGILMQKPDSAVAECASPAISNTIVGHPSVEDASGSYQTWSAYKDNTTWGNYVLDDAANHIGNDAIYINSIGASNTGFLPYDSRVKDKSLYVWMSGLLAPIELVKVFEQIEDGDDQFTVTTVGDNGTTQDDRILWTQVWAMPNTIEYNNKIIPMRYFANLTEMYVYQDGSTLPGRTYFYAKPGIKYPV
tara:strand:+ start:470 stop:6601 length:6132 start_codon:yes stop_codon:yes gene_type:complete